MSAKLKKVYDAAVAKLGGELTKALACSFGSTDGSAGDVPPARADGLAAALNRIMRGEGQMSMAQAKTLIHGERAKASEPESQEDVFASIRAKAYSRNTDADDDEAPTKPVAVIDPVSIYARWNASKPKPTEG